MVNHTRAKTFACSLTPRIFIARRFRRRLLVLLLLVLPIVVVVVVAPLGLEVLGSHPGGEAQGPGGCGGERGGGVRAQAGVAGGAGGQTAEA